MNQTWYKIKIRFYLFLLKKEKIIYPSEAGKGRVRGRKILKQTLC